MQHNRRKALPNPPRSMFPLFTAGTISSEAAVMLNLSSPMLSVAIKESAGLP